MQGDAESCSETVGNLELAGIVALVKSQSVRNQRLITRREQPAHMQQSAECASGVSAATKAEDEDMVAGIELSHQERINVGDVVGEAIAEGQTPHFRPPLSSGTQGISCPHRSDTGVIVGGLLVLRG